MCRVVVDGTSYSVEFFDWKTVELLGTVTERSTASKLYDAAQQALSDGDDDAGQFAMTELTELAQFVVERMDNFIEESCVYEPCRNPRSCELGW